MLKNTMVAGIYLLFNVHYLLAQNTTTIKYQQLHLPVEQTNSPKAYYTKRFKVIVSVLQPSQGNIEKEDILLETSLVKKTTESRLTQIQFSINNMNTINESFYYYKIMIGLKL